MTRKQHALLFLFVAGTCATTVFAQYANNGFARKTTTGGYGSSSGRRLGLVNRAPVLSIDGANEQINHGQLAAVRYSTARPAVTSSTESNQESLLFDSFADDSQQTAPNNGATYASTGRQLSNVVAPKSYYGPSKADKRRLNAAVYGGSPLSDNVQQSELFELDQQEEQDVEQVPESDQYSGIALGGANSRKSGYGAQSSTIKGRKVSGRGRGNVIKAAVQSKHTVHFKDVPVSRSESPKPITVEVGVNPVSELQFNFKTQSSPLKVSQEHKASKGSYVETQSEDEPHRLVHTVTRPIYQEVREVIQPFRKITQEIHPVQEEIETIVARQQQQQLENASQDIQSEEVVDEEQETQDFDEQEESQIDDTPIDSYSPSAPTSSRHTRPSTSHAQNGGQLSASRLSPKPTKTVSSPKRIGSYGPGVLSASVDDSFEQDSQDIGEEDELISDDDNFSANGQSLSTGVPNYGKPRYAGVTNQKPLGINKKQAKNRNNILSRSKPESNIETHTFTDDKQSTGTLSINRIGNGVAYKMMTFTMGYDAMKATQPKATATSNSERGGYGSLLLSRKPQQAQQTEEYLDEDEEEQQLAEEELNSGEIDFEQTGGLEQNVGQVPIDTLDYVQQTPIARRSVPNKRGLVKKFAQTRSSYARSA